MKRTTLICAWSIAMICFSCTTVQKEKKPGERWTAENAKKWAETDLIRRLKDK